MIQTDKQLHLLAGFGIASIFDSWWLGLIAVIIAAVAKELYDLYIKKTKFDKLDAIYTVAGGICGIIATMIF